MKIDYIHLSFFRCFTDLELTLAPSINVLTGDNSSGKTTLIEAIRCALSSFFAGFSDENTKFSGLSDMDFAEQVSSTGQEILLDKPVEVKFSLDGVEGVLQKNSRKNSRNLVSGIKYISDNAKDLYSTLFLGNQRVKPLPLFAYFSTSDVFKGPQNLPYNTKPSLGYSECLSGTALFYSWISRLLVLQEAGKGADEIEGVKQAIENALGEEGCKIIKRIDIRPNKKKVYFIFMDGREIDHEHLSDGYDRIVNIVLDIAFRALLLNKGVYGIEACRKTKGAVLIDEIDLHLHPELQILILSSLQNAFPSIQFIVSTHAPLIMSCIQVNENNKLFKFLYTEKEGYTYKEMDVHGMDASTILTTSMDAPNRDPITEGKLKELFRLIDEEKFADAEQFLEEFRIFSHQLPEFAQAKTMIELLK